MFAKKKQKLAGAEDKPDTPHDCAQCYPKAAKLLEAAEKANKGFLLAVDHGYGCELVAHGMSVMDMAKAVVGLVEMEPEILTIVALHQIKKRMGEDEADETKTASKH